jgi:hypothetical protein
MWLLHCNIGLWDSYGYCRCFPKCRPCVPLGTAALFCFTFLHSFQSLCLVSSSFLSAFHSHFAFFHFIHFFRFFFLNLLLTLLFLCLLVHCSFSLLRTASFYFIISFSLFIPYFLPFPRHFFLSSSYLNLCSFAFHSHFPLILASFLPFIISSRPSRYYLLPSFLPSFH